MPSPLRTVAVLLYAVAAVVAAVIVAMQFEAGSDVSLRELWWPAFVALVGLALHLGGRR